MTYSRTDDAIRALMQGQGQEDTRRPRGRNKLPPLAGPVPSGMAADQDAKRKPTMFGKLLSAVIPRRKYLVLAIAALVVFLWPWWALTAVLFSFALVNLAYFSLGHEVCTEKTVRAYIWLSGKSPGAAERIRLAAQRSSFSLGRMLGKLPQSWTTGLYLPDFDKPDLKGPLEELPDPFERLNGTSK